MNDDKILASPCISVCLLDNNDVCVGCYRTADEITEWMEADNETRAAILARSRERRLADKPHGLK